MSYEINTQYSTENLAAYTFRKSVMRNCQESDVVALLDLADDLHDLIRLRRLEQRRVVASKPAVDAPLVLAGMVLLD